MSRGKMQRSFFKDLQELYKKIETSTEGQAHILGVDEMSLLISLQPKSGFNAHAVFNVTVSFDGICTKILKTSRYIYTYQIAF